MAGGQRAPNGLPTKLLGYLCAALMAFMVFAMTVQVVGRYVMHSPPGWTEELARVAFIYATFFGAALGVARRAHLGIDLLTNALPVRARAVLQIAWRLLACVVLIVAAYQGYFLVERLSIQPLTSVPISKGWMFAGVPLGCVLILLFELRRIRHEIRVARTGLDGEAGPVVPRADFVVETHRN